MPEFDRQSAIKGAVDIGATPEQINIGLQSAGQSPLSNYEQTLIERGRYGQNIFQRLGSDALEFAQGLGSLGGGMYHYATDPQFRQGINDIISDYGQRVVSGEANPGVDIVNMFLTPYGTNLEEVVTNPQQAGVNAVSGALASPLNPILDSMTLLPVGKVADVVNKIPGINTPGLRGVRSALLPTNRERAVNNVLNLGEVKYAPQTAEIEATTRTLRDASDLTQAVRNLTLGTREGAEQTTTQLYDFAKLLSGKLEELGVSPNDAKRVAVSQRVYEIINPTRENRIPLQYVDDAIQKPTQENLERLGINKEQLDNIVNESNKLYDEGLIFPITQRGLNSQEKDLSALVDAGNRLSGVQAKRNIGSASIEDVADNIDRGYTLLYKDILNANIAQDSLQDIANRFGTKISPDDIDNVGKNQVVISPTEFRQNVKNLFADNKSDELSTTVNNVRDGLKGKSIRTYADDLYVIDKDDLIAFENRFKQLGQDSRLGSLVRAFQPIESAFKGTVLADAPYFFGNRAGNLILNTLGGADYIDLARRIIRGTSREDIPQYLRTSTSYFGMNPQLQDVGLGATWRDINSELRRAAQDLRKPDASVADRINALGRMIGGAQEYVTRPLFQGESTAELFDRSANYLARAREEAARTGQSVDDVVKQARTDIDLQNRLIQGVNRTLGDYTGRNWFINPTDRQAAQLLFPFYRIVNTSRDVLRNALATNPIGVQLAMREPARIGYNLMQADVEGNNQPNDIDTRGGLTLYPSYSSRFPRTVVYNNANPLVTPLEIAASILAPDPSNKGNIVNRLSETFTGNLTPIRGLMNILTGEDAYGNPVKGANTYTSGGVNITLDENGNKIEQSPDVLGAVINYTRSNFLPLANFMNTTVLPTVGAFTGEGFRRPASRSILGQVGEGFTIPYLYEGRNITEPMTTDIWQNELSQMGFRTRDVYRPYNQRLNEQLIRRVLQRRGRDMIIQRQREGE